MTKGEFAFEELVLRLIREGGDELYEALQGLEDPAELLAAIRSHQRRRKR